MVCGAQGRLAHGMVCMRGTKAAFLRAMQPVHAAQRSPHLSKDEGEGVEVCLGVEGAAAHLH